MGILKKKERPLPISKGCEVEASPGEDGFQGSWFRAILEQDPEKVKEEKLRVCYKTLLDEDGVKHCREYVERCFIRPVPPECPNEGVEFKEGVVVDAYLNDGWWNGVIVGEEADGSFLVYFDHPPDILKFDKTQLRPHHHWTGFTWQKEKDREVSKDMFSTVKLVEVTRTIGKKENVWVQSLVVKEIQGGDKREFLVKKYLGPSSQHLSDGEEEKCTAVDICKIRPSRPLNLCAEYELLNIVEVFVGYGWRKGVVREVDIDNNYKVCFEDTKEEAVFKNSDIRRFMEWQNNVWVEAHMKGFENEDNANVPTPAISSDVTPRDTLNKNHEMDNGTTIDAEPPIGERMSTSADKIFLPKRMFEPGSEKGVLQRVNKHCTLKYVAIVKEALGSDFKKIEDSFLGPIIQMGMRNSAMVFSRNLIHELLLRRIKVGKKTLWFSFGEQLMRFSLREFHLATGLPCLVGEEEKEEEASATKNKKKDPWMVKNHTVKTLVKLFVKNSKEFTANQKLRLGATILVESILIANNPVNIIPVERLLRARNFEEFCKYPWGNETYEALRAAVEKIEATDLVKVQYGISGFIYAIQLWALSSVDQLGSFFGDEDEETQFPLCLHWIGTKSPTLDEVTKIAGNKKVVAKCILGDQELHSNLVEEDVDTEFGKVVDLVKRGYRLKRQDWRSGSVNIAVAEAEIEENNYGPGSDATDKEKIEFLTKQLEIYKKKVEKLEDRLGIRRETEKETDEFHETPQGATKTKENDKHQERELEENECLQSFFDSIRQQVSKKKTQDKEEQLVDNDADDSEKERETSKDKEVS
ncbi:uncharacterized protein LOC108808200 [Raphanus sativus]|uniref:Uncharacterized protein LOC108808200 n=1 Tax=Raphanus sativus TaxID=3726 RepID=A0A9W3BUZ3_RAPSA|nr:uncharacterized protein LOC108808200 [Raphanus sativus]